MLASVAQWQVVTIQIRSNYMQDLVNRLNASQELTNQLLVRL